MSGSWMFTCHVSLHLNLMLCLPPRVLCERGRGKGTPEPFLFEHRPECICVHSPNTIICVVWVCGLGLFVGWRSLVRCSGLQDYNRGVSKILLVQSKSESSSISKTMDGVCTLWLRGPVVRSQVGSHLVWIGGIGLTGCVLLISQFQFVLWVSSIQEMAPRSCPGFKMWLLINSFIVINLDVVWRVLGWMKSMGRDVAGYFLKYDGLAQFLMAGLTIRNIKKTGLTNDQVHLERW